MSDSFFDMPALFDAFDDELEKISATQDMKALAVILRKAGLRGPASRLEAAAPGAPAAIREFLRKERFPRGRNVLPKKVRERAADALSKEPALATVMAIPTTPAGPLTYLALREGVGRAAKVKGLGTPMINLPESIQKRLPAEKAKRLLEAQNKQKASRERLARLIRQSDS